jgi:hypothetical protein
MFMKHVWMLNHYAQEPEGAGGTRHFSLGKHLLSHGWRTNSQKAIKIISL